MAENRSLRDAGWMAAPQSVHVGAHLDHGARALTNEITYTWVREVPDLDALEASWRALEADDTTTLFQTYDWVRHWCRHYVEQPRKSFARSRQNCLAIVVGRVAGRVVTIWPLTQKCGVRTARLEWLGAPVSQYGDALFARDVDPALVARASLDFLSQHSEADALVLNKVRDDSPLTAALEACNATCTGTDTAPFLSLAAGTDPTHANDVFPAKARKNRRRHRRRLREEGDVSFDVALPGEEAAALVAEAFAFKRAWLRKNGRVSFAFADDRIDSFFASLASGHAAPRIVPTVFVLRCGETPVAINIGFVSGETLLIHVAAYNPAFERFSPGSLLFEDSIRWACAQNLTAFDLMSPGDAYKRDWTSDTVIVRDFALGMTTRGRAWEHVYLRKIRPALKRVIAGAPQLVRPVKRLFNL
ncbi:MAG: GNAT family N-acetyltransferase [Pseudomonadota bacterium]